MRRAIGGISLATALLAQPGSASAQAWIGQIVGDMMAREAAYAAELRCMAGEAMPPNEVAEARDPAPAVMRGYWTAVSVGQSPAAAFQINRKTTWTSGSTVLNQTGLGKAVDPFARGGMRFTEAPIGFVRAGDGQSALGQWLVEDRPGHRGGIYQALLRRQGGVWKLSTLELVDARSWVDPVAQYCHIPGDIIPARVAQAQAAVERAERREVKAAKKAGETRRKAEQAAAARERSPGNATKAEASRLATTEAQRRAAEWATRQQEVATARDVQARAQADLAALEQQRAEGKAALLAAS